jgi:hypothetical protein
VEIDQMRDITGSNISVTQDFYRRPATRGLTEAWNSRPADSQIEMAAAGEFTQASLSLHQALKPTAYNNPNRFIKEKIRTCLFSLLAKAGPYSGPIFIFERAVTIG